MYFHLIGIKEKNGQNCDLNIILQGGDEDFIRKFLANRGVVIVSINEFNEDPNTFGNILVNLTYSETQIQLIAQGEDLSENMLFFVSLGLRPQSINFLNNPVPEDQMKNMLDSTLLSVEEENKKLKQQEEFEEVKEKKKYEESSIKDGLKIINSNINHMEQILKAGQGILSSHDIKEMENYLAEMKKIRLGTNFNKMASLILDSHVLSEKAESEIFKANEQNKFLIAPNSSMTNIDILREYFNNNRISEKKSLGADGLTTRESVVSIAGSGSIFLRLLRRDIVHYFDGYLVDDFFDVVLNSIEFIIILVILIVTLTWLVGPFVGVNSFSLYLLPAMGWLGLLIYLLNNLGLKGFISRIVYFLILVGVYRYGLTLLLATFAL